MCIFQMGKTLTLINLRKEECQAFFWAPCCGTSYLSRSGRLTPVSAFKVRRKPSALRKLMVTNSFRSSPCCISTILPPLPSQSTAGASQYKPGPAQACCYLLGGRFVLQVGLWHLETILTLANATSEKQFVHH